TDTNTQESTARGPPQRHECPDPPDHQMPDEINALNAERPQHALNGVGQPLWIAGPYLLGRPAMPRQIQSDDAPPRRQNRLGEHPGVEIGAKAVHQQYRALATLAEFEVT